MASGTIIFRPVASKGTLTSTVPSGTSVEDCWKLVNEETADDASTYVSVGEEQTLCFWLQPTVPVSFSSITSFTTYLKVSALSGSVLSSTNTSGLCTWDDGVMFCNIDPSFNANEWSLLSKEIPKYPMNPTDNETQLLAQTLSAVQNNNLGLTTTVLTDNNKDLVAMYSQIYVEIFGSYEEITPQPETSSIQIMENGQLVTYNATFYLKENGTWGVVDPASLPDGGYALQNA